MLLVTADHGMVTVDRTFDADTHPDLRRNVAAVGGDGRARHVYASPARRRTCSRPGDRCSATRAGWCRASRRSRRAGSARSDRTWSDRIGDVVVAARGSAAVTRTVAEPVISKLPGQHGSLSAEEQLIPLLLHRPA